ncbi:TIGR03750 family conjugal transfer protein [Paracidovorax avenae]|uniref:TIGR03750 family conjugal transfer protein n=1 Tax=Paracidovorax avenae TaxID=80867 RepID=UPI000D21BC3D|nr:TIGR03750 family conjugal transfer protein [Paracidovorax avenae]AVS67400.1 TIGR03750 family conjugal transfer protein [Paracidovorax avenae]
MAADDVRPPGSGAAAPLTDRVNTEPPIINGMSATEGGYVAAASFAFFLVVGLLLYLLTGYWHFIFACSVIGPVAVLWQASLYLQTVKRNKPEGWYVQAARLWLEDHGPGRKRYLRHHGYFELGRRIDFDVASRSGGTNADSARSINTPTSEQP